MTSYKELLQQRESLEREIEAARQRENGEAVAKARALIHEFGLTVDDVFGRKRGAAAQKDTGAKVAAKYRDPASGATWTGRGKPPKWISGKNREEFVIA